VRESWQDRFAELPDDLKTRQFQQASSLVLETKKSEPDSITTAGRCPLEMRFS
jgi:hypothetical protein